MISSSVVSSRRVIPSSRCQIILAEGKIAVTQGEGSSSHGRERTSFSLQSVPRQQYITCASDKHGRVGIGRSSTFDAAEEEQGKKIQAKLPMTTLTGGQGPS